MSNAKVGGEIDAYCGRCHLTLRHTILALVAGKIARVQCNTCKSDHALRSEAPTARGPAAPRARSQTSASSSALPFEEALAGKDVGQAREYRASERYEQGDLVRHPTFGLGIVTEVRQDKVEVTFKMAQRTLVHGRGAPGARPSFSPPSARAEGTSDKPPPPSEPKPAQ